MQKLLECSHMGCLQHESSLYEATDMAVAGEGVAEKPPHYLAPLSEHDALSRKWKLGAGLCMCEAAQTSASAESACTERCLHLFGLLSDGQPWQINVPFSMLGRYGGCVIGRSEESADIVLDEPGISRCHARLELTDDGLVVTDENSTNGVWVNDVQLSAYERQMPLDDGATLTLGNIILRAEFI